MLKKIRASFACLVIAGAAMAASFPSSAFAAEPATDVIIIVVCDDVGCDVVVIETR